MKQYIKVEIDEKKCIIKNVRNGNKICDYLEVAYNRLQKSEVIKSPLEEALCLKYNKPIRKDTRTDQCIADEIREG